MNVTELSQIVVHPDRADLADEAREAIDEQVPDPPLTIRIRVRLWLGRLLHPLMHTWIRWYEYDEQSGRAIDTGGLTCAYCPRGKR